MDKEKIEQLKERRLILQEEVRLKNIRNRVAAQLAHIEKLGQSYTAYYESENLNWIDANVRVRKKDGYHGIHGDFQIDVDDSSAINILQIRDEVINADIFKKQVVSVISEESSIIVCYLGGDPELEISIKAFIDNPNIYFSRPETWIITTDKKWIIEYIWEQEVIRFIQLQELEPTLVTKIRIEG